MRCAAHTMNLVATKDTKDIIKDDKKFSKVYNTAMNKARKLWFKQGKSPLSADKIEKHFTKRFKTPVKTRWNTWYDSVKTLLEILDSLKGSNSENLKTFNRVISGKPIECDVPFDAKDIEFFRAYVRAMEPIAIGLDIMQQEKKAYMGILLPIIIKVIKELDKLLVPAVQENRGMATVKILIETMKKGMEERFETYLYQEQYMLATCFHPDFRMEWMRGYYETTQIETTKLQMIDKLTEEMCKLSGPPPTPTPEVEVTQRHGQEEQEQLEEEEGSSPSDSWFTSMQAKGTRTPAPAGEVGSQEFREYQERIRTNATQIIEIWCSGKATNTLDDTAFLNNQAMINVFIKLNTGLPTSASVERLFSIGKIVLRDNRTKLSDKLFGKLMFLKGNLEVISNWKKCD